MTCKLVNFFLISVAIRTDGAKGIGAKGFQGHYNTAVNCLDYCLVTRLSQTVADSVHTARHDSVRPSSCVVSAGVKNIHISADILRRVLHYFNRTGSVYLCIRKSTE